MRKPGKAEKWAARSERLSAALRENLKRRKAQARARAAGAAPADDDASGARARANRRLPTFAAIGAASRVKEASAKTGNRARRALCTIAASGP